MHTFEYAPRNQAFTRAIQDLAEGLTSWRLWTTFGYEELRHSYRRTLLGLVWIAISFGAFSVVKIIVFAGLNAKDADVFTTWVVTGFLIWQFVSHIVVTGSAVFISSESWIKGVKLPYSIHIYQTIWRLALQDGINLLVAYVLVVLFGAYSLPGLLLGLLAIPLFLLTAVPVQLLLGILCTHSRDLQQFIGTAVRLLFFATPIIWIPVPGTFLETIARLNPFSYILALFRDPVIYGVIPLDALAVWAGITAFFWIAGLAAFSAFRSRIYYWL